MSTVEIQAFQQRVQTRLGDDLSNERFNGTLSSVVREATGIRSLLDLDGGDWELVTDEHLCDLVGQLALPVLELACVLGVDLAAALARAESAAEARAASVQVDAEQRLVSKRGTE